MANEKLAETLQGNLGLPYSHIVVLPLRGGLHDTYEKLIWIFYL